MSVCRWVWVFDSTDMQMKHVLDPRVRSAEICSLTPRPFDATSHSRLTAAVWSDVARPRCACAPGVLSACAACSIIDEYAQVGISIARMLTRRYKDSVSDIFVLNANAILRVSLFVVCPFLEKKVVDKIHIEVPGKSS